MADPFATGLGTLFAGPRAVAAVYDDGSSARPVRVIHERPDQETSFRDSIVVQATNLFRIQTADVAEPAIDHLITVEAGTFRISEEPQRDTQALRWICPAEPV